MKIKYIKENIPRVKMRKPEGTYLLWLDCSGLGLSREQLDRFMIDEAELWLDGGSLFGEEGNSFQRINAACRRETLEKALEQLKAAVDAL